jgi:putative signal transducing protein
LRRRRRRGLYVAMRVIVKKPNPNELVSVFDNIDTSLVLIARDVLASVKIDSFIFDATTSSILRTLSPLLSPARLMVYADKADEARKCLRELGIDK